MRAAPLFLIKADLIQIFTGKTSCFPYSPATTPGRIPFAKRGWRNRCGRLCFPTTPRVRTCGKAGRGWVGAESTGSGLSLCHRPGQPSALQSISESLRLEKTRKIIKSFWHRSISALAAGSSSAGSLAKPRRRPWAHPPATIQPPPQHAYASSLLMLGMRKRSPNPEIPSLTCDSC